MTYISTRKVIALLLSAVLTLCANKSYSQCGTTPITGDLIISSNQSLSGTYNITGLFQVDAGVIVTVTPYSGGGCGELIINASSINVQGTINGDFAGGTGGTGGAGATTGTNLTYLTNCNDKDDCYTVTVNGGTQGSAGTGNGAGANGTAGGSGFGPKQACENIGDTYGMVGSGGGAGAGGGGSYGGSANNGGNGGAGTAAGSFTGMTVSTCSTPTAGPAGGGGTAGATYGTQTGADIDMGSGGAGASGGGKSSGDGVTGGNGGTGGGKIVLNSSGTLTVAGTISAQGSVGGSGGNGGIGGKTSRCCSDGCDGCDETTYSAGAGGGGGAGGGSGGGIYLQANGDMLLTGTLRAEGGNGGLGGQGGAGATPCNYSPGFPENLVCNGNTGATNAGANGAMGGGGSGGRVKVFQNPCRNNVINANVLLSGGNGNAGAASTGTVHYGNLPGILAPTGSVLATNIDCFGGNNGTATATPAGGLAPYTYLWDDVNAQTTASATGLASGTYTVTITDDNGCSVTASGIVTEPALLTSTGSLVTDASCNGAADGVADVTPGGGTPNYTYLWDDANAQTSSSAIGLSAGTYNVTVTDDNGCTATATVTISEPPALSSTVAVDNDVSCNGGSDGQATVSPSGGTPGYTFFWDNFQTGATATGLGAGSIDVTVTDNAGCQQTLSVSITEPTVISAIATPLLPVLCNGGNTASAFVAVSGGTPGYTFLWDDISNTANDTVVNLPAGTYTVSILDNNQCPATASVTIDEPLALAATVNTDSNVDCNGGNNGQLTVTPTDGTSPYTYLWSDASAQTGQTAAALEAGIYAVVVTDDNGCEITVSNIQISEPPALTVALTSTTNVTCNGNADGQATITAGGGVPPYLYDWNDPANQTQATATNLAPGSYDVTVTDDNGCTFNFSNITITEPTPLVAGIASHNDVNCNGGNDGQAAGAATGGTGPYTFFWTPSGATTTTISNLTAGEYILLVTDANGCTDSDMAIILEPVNPLTAGFIADPDTGLQPLEITFTNTSVGASSWEWFFGDGESSTELNPVHVYEDSGAFTVILVVFDSITGCTDTFLVDGGIYVIPTSIFEVPNVFTPNGDGFNDLFNPNSRNITEFSGEVFNRWGEKVYGWTLPQGGWDGHTPSGHVVPEGTYFYTLKASGVDNISYEKKGSIMLIR